MVQVVRKTDANAWAKLFAMAKTFKKTELKVGWFSTSTYADGTPVAYIATIHEFGDAKGGIPPRPFMRPTIAREENNWRRFIAQEAPKILDGKLSVQDFFTALGLNVSGEIAASIEAVSEPALLEATIKAKVKKMADGGTTGALDKPLVETGQMLSSVTFTVGDQGAE